MRLSILSHVLHIAHATTGVRVSKNKQRCFRNLERLEHVASVLLAEFGVKLWMFALPRRRQWQPKELPFAFCKHASDQAKTAARFAKIGTKMFRSNVLANPVFLALLLSMLGPFAPRLKTTEDADIC